MTVKPLGRINVPSPGTPVALVAGRTPANKIHFELPTAVASIVYLKDAASGTVIKEMQGGAKPNDSFDISTQDGMNSLYVDQYTLDAASAGTGAYVTYWQE